MTVPQPVLPRLLKGEVVESVEEFDYPLPPRLPSTLLELAHLAGALSQTEIGEYGPVLAAMPLESKQYIPEYNRYRAIFGRDSLRVAKNLIYRYPELTKTTLLTLAALQGVQYENSREEEPGRIVHEVRDPLIDPVARQLSKDRGWGWPYYGSHDATLEFIRTLSAYCLSQPDRQAFLDVVFKARDGKQLTMRDAFTAAVSWMTRRMDANREGLLEFHRAIPRGIENQVWRDAWDSFHHADGTMANHDLGVASTELQRAAVDTLLDAAQLYEVCLNKKDVAEGLRERAAKLEAHLFDWFWTDDKGGYFVLGLDRDEHGKHRQLKIRTSDMGHLLHSRLLFGKQADSMDRVSATVEQLFSGELLGRNGVRTLASDEYRYRPGAYQNGSSWPWENYLIAQGLDLHGFSELADTLKKIILDIVNVTHCLPEYARGDDDPAYRLNTRKFTVWDEINQRYHNVEEPPQEIHATTAGAVLAIKLESSRKPTPPTRDRHKIALEKKLLQNISFMSELSHIDVSNFS